MRYLAWTWLGAAIFIIDTSLLALWETFWPRFGRTVRTHLATAGLLCALLALGWLWLRAAGLQLGLFQLDRNAGFFSLLILVVTLLSVLQVAGDKTSSDAMQMLAALGAIIMVATNSLIMIFLGYSLLLWSLVIIAGLSVPVRYADEVRFKSFVPSGLATAFFLGGIALWQSSELNTFGLVFILIAIAYMMSWAPFHFSMPDVVEGASNANASFLSVLPKIAGLAVVLRLFNDWTYSSLFPWVTILTLGTVVCWVFGHLAALAQPRIKRRLAYASVAQLGYLLMGCITARSGVAIEETALQAVYYYAVAYGLLTIGVFAILDTLPRPCNVAQRGGVTYEDTDFNGLGEQAPGRACLLSLFLLGLAGLPPSMGFLGKFWLISQALMSGQAVLAAVALVGWVISAYYYLELILAIYGRPARNSMMAPARFHLNLVLFLCAFPVIYWGLFPGTLLAVIKESIRGLLY